MINKYENSFLYFFQETKILSHLLCQDFHKSIVIKIPIPLNILKSSKANGSKE